MPLLSKAGPAALFVAALLSGCASVPPPTAQLSGVAEAIRSADARDPRGPARLALDEARQRQSLALDAADRGRNAEAMAAALEARAAADYAAAEARRAALEEEIESKAARNADLRRRLLVQGE